MKNKEYQVELIGGPDDGVLVQADSDVTDILMINQAVPENSPYYTLKYIRIAIGKAVYEPVAVWYASVPGLDDLTFD